MVYDRRTRKLPSLPPPSYDTTSESLKRESTCAYSACDAWWSVITHLRASYVVGMHVRVCECAYMCVCARAHVCVCVCVYACVRASMAGVTR